MSLNHLKQDLLKLKSPERAIQNGRFFKTGKGDYAEHDVFLGILVPEQRKIAKTYQSLDLSEVLELLKSKVHEERLVALFILTTQYQKGSAEIQELIASKYLEHTQFINNWDLVDTSAYKILGHYLFNYKSDIQILEKLAKSQILWERRIAIVATFYFIQRHNPEPTLLLSKRMLKDSHHLIQKAIGWMLREVGKRISVKFLEDFLNEYHQVMPRIMLSYAIERMCPEQKTKYRLPRKNTF